MAIEASLTVGWPRATVLDALEVADDRWAEVAAVPDRLREKEEAVVAALSALRDDDGRVRVSGLERLFRRRTAGFKPIQWLLGVLTRRVGEEDPGWILEIDAFAYAFLTGAKNFDLILPDGGAGDYRGRFEPDCRYLFRRLEAFERDGVGPRGFDRETYLDLRRVISRPSAREERRILATLLFSGPSTTGEISEDLGLRWTLDDRAIAAVRPAVDRRGEKYVLCPKRLPLVLFLLRERMGLDPCGALARRS